MTDETILAYFQGGPLSGQRARFTQRPPRIHAFESPEGSAVYRADSTGVGPGGRFYHYVFVPPTELLDLRVMDDEQLLSAIRNYYNDKRRSLAETKAGLQALAEELDIMIDSIKTSDDSRGD